MFACVLILELMVALGLTPSELMQCLKPPSEIVQCGVQELVYFGVISDGDVG